MKEKSVFCKVSGLVHTALQLPRFCHVTRVPTLCEQVTGATWWTLGTMSYVVGDPHCVPHSHLSQLLVGISWGPAIVLFILLKHELLWIYKAGQSKDKRTYR